MKNINKKYIYIGIGVLLLIVIVVIILLNKSNNNNNDVLTCTSGEGLSYQEWIFEPKDNLLSKLTLKFNKSAQSYDYETLTGLTESQKQEIQKELLYDMGIDKLTYDGIEIKLTYDEYLSIEINIDYSIADKNILKKLGLNYNKETKFSVIKALITTEGSYTCK